MSFYEYNCGELMFKYSVVFDWLSYPSLHATCKVQLSIVDKFTITVNNSKHETIGSVGRLAQQGVRNRRTPGILSG